MANNYWTRPLSWYAKQAPPDDETEEEIKEHNRQITRELDAWCNRKAEEKRNEDNDNKGNN